MSNKLAHLETLLTDLSKERMELDAAIEQMMANMAEVPAEKRSASDWASDGALTKQFLDLREPRIIAAHRQAHRLYPGMIPLCSRFDSMLFTPKRSAIASYSNFSRSP
jgi:hypothetical protein